MPDSDLQLQSQSDEALMQAYGRGEARAFESLYARHKGATYRYFLRHLGGDPAAADELHQDLWLRVIHARQRYEPRAAFSTWLYTLARHRLVDHWRSPLRHSLASFEDDGVLEQAEQAAADARGDGEDPLVVSIDAESRHRLVTALSGVPPLQRDAFLLHVEAGLSLEAIASLTSTPTETVKSRLRYAYRRLREALEDPR